MAKPGKPILSVINAGELIPSVWDPHVYRRDGQGQALSDFATVQTVNPKSVAPASLPFNPIEYRDIPRGYYLSCALRLKGSRDSSSWPVVGEGELLFGTLRAYLGNVVVTPLAEWLDQKRPIYFHVKSEFVVVSPHDGLPYFWLAYLRSKEFLENLPLGSGGTRPRLQPKALAQAPVSVPPLKARQAVHEALTELARQEWQNYVRAAAAFDALGG